MIGKKVEEALNGQINKEIYSAYLYLAMSAYCRAEGLNGFAGWLGIQSREEWGHAIKLIKYLEDQGARVRLGAIAEPPADFGSARKVFEETLNHEQMITASIHDAMDLAVKEKDYATQGLLQWFVTEQVEEESTVADIVNKLKLVGGDARGIFMIDRELGARAAG